MTDPRLDDTTVGPEDVAWLESLVPQLLRDEYPDQMAARSCTCEPEATCGAHRLLARYLYRHMAALNAERRDLRRRLREAPMDDTTIEAIAARARRLLSPTETDEQRDARCAPLNDRTWGEGNWLRCPICAPDSEGRQVYHHVNAHGPEPLPVPTVTVRPTPEAAADPMADALALAEEFITLLSLAVNEDWSLADALAERWAEVRKRA